MARFTATSFRTRPFVSFSNFSSMIALRALCISMDMFISWLPTFFCRVVGTYGYPTCKFRLGLRPKEGTSRLLTFYLAACADFSRKRRL